MGDVVRFSTRIWACECGCSTFCLYENGQATCAACDRPVGIEGQSGWIERTDPRATPPEDLEIFKSVRADTLEHEEAIAFARRRAARIAAEDSMAIIVSVRRDGSMNAWSQVDTAKGASWIKRKLRDAAVLISRRLPEDE